MRNKRNNNFHNSSVNNGIAFMLIVFSALVIIFCFWNKDDIGNLYVSFSDFSKTKEDISCKIIFDDSIVYKIEKISESKAIYLVLQNGKHKVEISDLNNRYYLQDYIFIKNYPEENNLFVSFEYNPSYEEYLPIFQKQYFDRLIEKHNLELSVEEKASVLEQINKKIDVDYLKRTHYKPIERRFEITFYDEPIYLN